MSADGGDTPPPQQKRCGVSRMQKVYTRTTTRMITLNVHKVGNNAAATEMVRYMRTKIRDSHLVPMNIFNWKNVPVPTKDRLWEIACEKYTIPAEGRKWFDQSMGGVVKSYRELLKKSHFERHSTHEVRVANRPSDIPEYEWVDMVRHWESTEIQHERRGDDTYPSRCEMFIKTHKHQNDTWVDANAERAGVAMVERLTLPTEHGHSVTDHERIYTDVMGPEKYGRVRSVGMGPSPTSFKYAMASSSSASSSRTLSQSSSDRPWMADMAQLQESLANLIGGLLDSRNDGQSSQSACGDTSALEVGKKVIVSDASGQVVALGELVSLDEGYNTQSGRCLGPYDTAVRVDHPIQLDAVLPYPETNMRTLGGVMGYIVRWHKYLLKVILTITPLIDIVLKNLAHTHSLGATQCDMNVS